MKITVERFTSNADATLSTIWVDGAFECFGLEDAYHALKIPGQTRIPAGTYRVTLRDEGGMTRKYANRFPRIHRGMLWLRDVPGFDWVYFHVGNRHEDTEGCILVADGADARPGNMHVPYSTGAYERLYAAVAEAADQDRLTAEIIDRDRG